MDYVFSHDDDCNLEEPITVSTDSKNEAVRERVLKYVKDIYDSHKTKIECKDGSYDDETYETIVTDTLYQFLVIDKFFGRLEKKYTDTTKTIVEKLYSICETYGEDDQKIIDESIDFIKYCGMSVILEDDDDDDDEDDLDRLENKIHVSAQKLTNLYINKKSSSVVDPSALLALASASSKLVSSSSPSLSSSSSSSISSSFSSSLSSVSLSSSSSSSTSTVVVKEKKQRWCDDDDKDAKSDSKKNRDVFGTTSELKQSEVKQPELKETDVKVEKKIPCTPATAHAWFDHDTIKGCMKCLLCDEVKLDKTICSSHNYILINGVFECHCGVKNHDTSYKIICEHSFFQASDHTNVCRKCLGVFHNENPCSHIYKINNNTLTCTSCKKSLNVRIVKTSTKTCSECVLEKMSDAVFICKTEDCRNIYIISGTTSCVDHAYANYDEKNVVCSMCGEVKQLDYVSNILNQKDAKHETKGALTVCMHKYKNEDGKLVCRLCKLELILYLSQPGKQQCNKCDVENWAQSQYLYVCKKCESVYSTIRTKCEGHSFVSYDDKSNICVMCGIKESPKTNPLLCTHEYEKREHILVCKLCDDKQFLYPALNGISAHKCDDCDLKKWNDKIFICTNTKCKRIYTIYKSICHKHTFVKYDNIDNICTRCGILQFARPKLIDESKKDGTTVEKIDSIVAGYVDEEKDMTPDPILDMSPNIHDECNTSYDIITNLNMVSGTEDESKFGNHKALVEILKGIPYFCVDQHDMFSNRQICYCVDCGYNSGMTNGLSYLAEMCPSGHKYQVYSDNILYCRFCGSITASVNFKNLIKTYEPPTTICWYLCNKGEHMYMKNDDGYIYCAQCGLIVQFTLVHFDITYCPSNSVSYRNRTCEHVFKPSGEHAGLYCIRSCRSKIKFSKLVTSITIDAAQRQVIEPNMTPDYVQEMISVQDKNFFIDKKYPKSLKKITYVVREDV